MEGSFSKNDLIPCWGILFLLKSQLGVQVRLVVVQGNRVKVLEFPSRCAFVGSRSGCRCGSVRRMNLAPDHEGYHMDDKIAVPLVFPLDRGHGSLAGSRAWMTKVRKQDLEPAQALALVQRRMSSSEKLSYTIEALKVSMTRHMPCFQRGCSNVRTLLEGLRKPKAPTIHHLFPKHKNTSQTPEPLVSFSLDSRPAIWASCRDKPSAESRVAAGLLLETNVTAVLMKDPKLSPKRSPLPQQQSPPTSPPCCE